MTLTLDTRMANSVARKSDVRPRALVMHAAGTNCNAEMVRAFEQAGAAPERVHLDRLIAEPSMIESFDLIGVPGGFSYGDDIAAGRVLAMRMRTHLYGALRDASMRGVPIIGVCNGFQALVQCGLLPGLRSSEHDGKSIWPDESAESAVTLADNAGGRFIDSWVRVEANAASPCIWTKGLHDVSAEAGMLPLASGEGRFVAASQSVLDALDAGGHIALRYVDNINGSQGAIAGICDASGRVFGLMPHPDRYLSWDNHPFATRLDDNVRMGDTPGVAMFRGAVEAAKTVANRPR